MRSKLLISTPCVSKLLQSVHQMALVEVEVLKRRVGCNVLLSLFQESARTHLPRGLDYNKLWTQPLDQLQSTWGDGPSLRSKTHRSSAEGTIAAFPSCMHGRLLKKRYVKTQLLCQEGSSIQLFEKDFDTGGKKLKFSSKIVFRSCQDFSSWNSTQKTIQSLSMLDRAKPTKKPMPCQILGCRAASASAQNPQQLSSVHGHPHTWAVHVVL